MLRVTLYISGIFIFFMKNDACAQQGPHDTIRVGTIITDTNDTLLHIWINEVTVLGKAPVWLVKQRRQRQREDEEYRRLRYNVQIVYPYAVKAAIVLQDVDSMLSTLQSKDAKRMYKHRKEDDLKRQFKGELEDLTIDQGKILIKLIARETGKPCYTIVKDLKGGFNAGIWQTVAIIFSHNLRNTYDAQGEDSAIETIVQEILAKNKS
jgi:hypothetical protein